MFRYSSIAFSLQKYVSALEFHTVTAQIWPFLENGILAEGALFSYIGTREF